MLQKLLEKFLIVCLSKEKGPEIGSSPPSKVSWKTLMKRMKETAIKDLEYYGTRDSAGLILCTSLIQIIRQINGSN